MLKWPAVHVVLVAVLLPHPAPAQSREFTADFGRVATRLTGAMRRDGPIRVGVMPVRGSIRGVDAAVMVRLPDQLTRALRSTGRPMQFVDPADIDRALAELGVPTGVALQPGAATRAGVLSTADYVVLATLVPDEGGRWPARMNVQLLEVRSGRTLEAIATDLMMTSAAPVSAPAAQKPSSPPPPPPPTTVTTKPAPEPAPTSSRGSHVLTTASGFAVAGGAAVLAWSKNQDLKSRKSRLAALPAGATDEFNRQFAEAQQVLKARNRWFGVAAAVAGATTSYLLMTRLADRTPIDRPSNAKPPPRTSKWLIGLTLAAPGIAVVRSF